MYKLKNSQLPKQAYETIREIFKNISPWQNGESALLDVSLITALAKKDEYETECQFFEKKYRMSFKEFERKIYCKKKKEDFEKDHDFMDWEFAQETLRYWNQQIKLLKSYAQHSFVPA